MTLTDAVRLESGSEDFLNALAALVELCQDAARKTVPEDEHILQSEVKGTPFEWIAGALTELEVDDDFVTVDDVLTGMGVDSFVCQAHHRLIEGEDAKRGLAYGIASERVCESVSPIEVANLLRKVATVLPKMN